MTASARTDGDAARPGIVGANGVELTPRGRRTRGKLVAAAREVLEAVGYPAATVTGVTDKSGVSLGTFYRYFDNKEELFLLLLRSLVETLYDAVGGAWQSDDAEESLRVSTLRYLTAYHENRLLIGALRDMASSVPKAAELWWELRQQTYQRMRGNMEDLASRRGMNPDLAVAALGGMVEQFAYFWYVEGERYGHVRDMPPLEEAARDLSTIWHRSLYLDGEASAARRSHG